MFNQYHLCNISFVSYQCFSSVGQLHIQHGYREQHAAWHLLLVAPLDSFKQLRLPGSLSPSNAGSKQGYEL